MPRQDPTGRPILSPRQAEVIRLVSLGCSSREIAAILRMSVSTVEGHKLTAKRLLGTGNAVLATRLVLKHKYSALDDKLSPEEERLSGRKNNSWKLKPARKSQGGVQSLSPLQTKIVRLTSLGCGAADISAILGIDGRVVTRRKTAALQTLGIENSAILTRLAFKFGITSCEDRLSRAEAQKAGPDEPRSYSRNVAWIPPLTQRRKQVIRLTSLACSTYEIAAILGIPASTVHNDRHAVARIIGSGKLTLATRYAICRNISSLDDQLTAAEKRKSGRKYDGWN